MAKWNQLFLLVYKIKFRTCDRSRLGIIRSQLDEKWEPVDFFRITQRSSLLIETISLLTIVSNSQVDTSIIYR